MGSQRVNCIFIASTSSLQGLVAGLTFYGDKGTLAVTKSEENKAWGESVKVNIRQINGKHVIICKMR